jgi:transglutaminase-like putative cysteine protease
VEISRVHSIKKVLLQLLLLVAPTVAVICFALWRLNNFYSILQNEWLLQGIYFSIGSIVSIIIFGFRFRFISVTLLILLINYLLYLLTQYISISEFDGFLISVKFYIFTLLFAIGWFTGYGFSRSKYISLVWSILLLVIEIVLVSKTADITVTSLMNGLVPILIYSFYIIYTNELIRNLNEDEVKMWWFIGKRLAAFALVLLLLFVVILSLYNQDFKTIEKKWGGASSKETEKGDGNSESMTKETKGGGISNKDQSKLSGSLSKDKKLVFVAKLDHFFEGTSIPNPLYFTSHYYTKFDTATQTFEVDENIPYNDLFKVNPAKVPLYFRETDSTIITKSLGRTYRKIVDADVYNVNLSQDAFLAPSNAFYCQPVSVPKEYRSQFRSAYHAKMWVSELNSAYFIYNPAGNKELERFQEARFEKLREINTIRFPDKKFQAYYTYMPLNKDYEKIEVLAKKITKNEPKPIDKIIAIRNYFLSKDEFDQPLFAYSDNPGIPGMPSANKLTYFLFENRKGYCAYFAGATLFMLRSLGIPSRVVVGYATADRSSKNPGWYWFYQDQAHAWVQVYFQEYGWIDFDTTIPDVNTQQASQPDGTPPMDFFKAYLVIDGKITTIDTIKKQVTLSALKILYHDTDFVAKKPLSFLTDVSIAVISNDTGAIKLKDLKKGMNVTAVSHAEILKRIFTKRNDSLTSLSQRLPKPIPIDELKVMNKDQNKKQTETATQKKSAPINWLNILRTILWTLLIAVFIVFLTPWICWFYFNAKAKKTYLNNANSAYHINKAVLYYLNQMNYPYHEMGPAEYAAFIDKTFNTKMILFNQILQKIKYSQLPLNEQEIIVLHTFYQPFIFNIRQGIVFKKRLKNFFILNYTLRFFTKYKTN